MRICVVSGTFHPEPGGPPTFLYRLLPELVRRGHEIEVVTYGESDAPTDYPYPVSRISRRRPIPLRLIAFTRAVLKAGRWADAFFVCDYGLPVIAANVLLRKPVVLRVVADFAWEFCQRHGWIEAGQSVMDFQTAHHTLRVQLLRWTQVAYARAATRVIVPSEYVARLVRGWGSNPRVIYNAIELEPFRDLLVCPAGHDLITVARLTPVKGVDVIIRAFALLRPMHPPADLTVVGDGPARVELETLCRDLPLDESVSFTGALTIDDVARRMAAADGVVLGSRTEGLPHVVLEAMAARTPVVATRVGGTPEVVKDGVNGLLVPAEDPGALAEAVSKLWSDAALADRLQQGGLSTLDRFSWRRLVDEYDEALRNAVLKND